MTEDSDAVGSMRSSAAQRTALALDSLKFNMRDKLDLLHLHFFQCSLASGCLYHSFLTKFHNGASNWRSERGVPVNHFSFCHSSFCTRIESGKMNDKS
jgi:hypothetical protein